MDDPKRLDTCLVTQSWFSLMEGSSSPDAICAAMAAGGYASVALTDRNALYALPEFVDLAIEAGLKPIAGAKLEFPGEVPLFAWCMDRLGYGRLCAVLSSILAEEAPRRRARLPPEAFVETSAEDCLASDGAEPRGSRLTSSRAPGFAAPRRVNKPDADEGKPAEPGPVVRYLGPTADFLSGGWEGLALASGDPATLERLRGKAIPGSAPLYGLLAAGRPQLELARFCRDRGLPLLAVQDAAIFGPDDRELRALLAAVERRTTLSALPARPDWAEAGPERELFDAGSLSARFSAFPEAVANANALAARAADARDFFSETPVFPAWRGLPNGEAFRLLRADCEAAIPRRFGPGGPGRRDLLDRLAYELRIIGDKGFAGYFLVVRDIVARCPRTCGRGSAASSVVSYLLGLTHVDPLAHNLFFERFLNDDRRDPPDIDIDFPWDERHGVLRSVFEEYRGRSALVADHCRFTGRSRIREAACALGIDVDEIGKLVRLARREGPACLPPRLARLAELVRDAPRYIGSHPGGVIVTPGPITDYLHVQPSPLGFPVGAWEKDGTERAGLVKIDLLGNRSLAVLRDCIGLVNLKEEAGKAAGAPEPLAWGSFNPMDEPSARTLIESGDTMGIFYIESPATRQLLRKMRVADYGHLVVASSIIRPAANRFIGEYVRRLRGGSWRRLPEAIEDALAETCGIMVYQEDVSRVAIAAAGFGAAEADGLRKVLTKKRKGDTLLRYRERFFAGCRAKGVPSRDAAELWEMMCSFDGYSFCKAHSASYALVSYRLAWMKARHPAEFIVSVINNGGGFYGTQAYLGEARRMGFRILPPHVNQSATAYLAVPPRSACDTGGVLVGLGQIAELSSRTLERIAKARERSGPFGSLDDFVSRVRPDLADVRGLIRSGALDGLPARPGGPHLTRPQAFWACHRARRSLATDGSSEPGLFEAAGDASASVDAPAFIRDYTESTKLADEVATMGLVVSRPPSALFLERAARIAAREGLPALADTRTLPERLGSRVSIAGVTVAEKEVLTKRRDAMCFASFEDPWGLFETVIFPQAYGRLMPMLETYTALLVVGMVRSDQGALVLHLETAFGLNRPGV
ncbi:MAG: PHP domain-containing protein [Spirochaetes bacterium]|nr:PHP domain-containing protein [Spirochaetota bacterium]